MKCCPFQGLPLWSGSFSHSLFTQKISEHVLYVRILGDRASLARIFKLSGFVLLGLKEMLEVEMRTHRDATTGLFSPMGIIRAMDGTRASVSWVILLLLSADLHQRSGGQMEQRKWHWKLSQEYWPRRPFSEWKHSHLNDSNTKCAGKTERDKRSEDKNIYSPFL